jgi:hypothetical protein
VKPLKQPLGCTLLANRSFEILLFSFLLAGSSIELLAQPAELFTRSASFKSTNHLVSVSVFQWFSANGGQLSGPWRPAEGRPNWTGNTDFWRAQIKQMMTANADILYVHLIPSSEGERINLFRALNQLRREGWNVPKVAPFLDPMITWNGQPMVNLHTAAGKDEFVGHYIRFFNQYYSVNQDAAADDYLARIDGRIVLDTWHVKFNLTNLDSLSRLDVESRLQAAFGANHPIFTNGIRMITTALNDPTLNFADEKVPQFEINSYYAPYLWKGIWSAQLKGGYWDQNIRNPGDFLPRNGGVPYSNAWNQAVAGRASLRRVYLESWNEYDEGSGIYAANPGPPYILTGSGNTNTDTWSTANNAYEYIKTTARGATSFNDWPNRDAKILWHNLPTRLLPGETRTATVIVRNEGDISWTAGDRYRFGQKEYIDPVVFGAGRYFLNDSQDEIPSYGGIFRGRTRTFQLTLRAPLTPGTYRTHWGMLQENVQWFGEEISQTILVDPVRVYRGSPQSVDSTSIFTNVIDDFTEHTYVAQAGPVGSFAECRVTRTFAAPVKSVRLTVVSGTADDIGYVGNTLVTPNSQNTPNCSTLGYVLAPVNVSSQVTIRDNTATLTLRARENCCCVTGWGEETDPSRANAKLRWQVELAPPVPIGPVLTNSANGHFYALLSPATWTWSERAAVALGGHLSAIANSAEQDWVYNNFSTYNGTNRLLWIGFNDVATEGRFTWTSGEPVLFSNWAPGEPNNVNNEDFTAIYEPGHPNASRWNDFGERITSGNLPINGVIELIPPQGPPRINSQPRDVMANTGSRVSFVVGANGSPTLRYQWRRNGVNISGATRSAYTIENVLFVNAGTYSVVVTNALGSATSMGAVLDVNRPPVARCLSATAPAGPNCMAEVSVNNNSSDPEGDPILITQTPPGPYPLGITRVVLTVRDRPFGLSSSCEASVTVFDATPPTVICPSDITRNTDSDQCGAVVTFASATASDLCSPVTNINCTPASGSFFPVGVTVVQCTARDTAGNIGRCSFNVTVRDTEAPVLTCPVESITVTNAHDAWTSTVTYDVSVADNCPGGASPVCNPVSGSSLALGTNLVICSATDAAENSAECRFNVVVYPGNFAPIPIIQISPLANISGITNWVVIAPDGLSAVVLCDGSRSYDPDDTNLLYFWYEGTNRFSTNAIAQERFALGFHTLTLTLDDTYPLGTNSTSLTFEVISPLEAANNIIELINHSGLADNRMQPLVVALKSVQASFERGNIGAGINHLMALQNKVRAQIAQIDPHLAQQLIQTAQAIIDAEKGL